MNEDYLWDKTGDDAEIEKLENALKAFQYKETAPPALPAKVLAFEPKAPRRFFRFSLSFAAFATILIAFAGVWFKFSGEKIEVAKDVMKITAPQQIAEIPKEVVDKKSDDAISAKTDDLTVTKVKDSQSATKRKVSKTKKFTAIKADLKNTKNIEPQLTAVKLTKEEKYAYDQLMLALTFTGSKLKIVKDKVEGIEEQNAVLEK